jgi:peroxiredoxin
MQMKTLKTFTLIFMATFSINLSSQEISTNTQTKDSIIVNLPATNDMASSTIMKIGSSVPDFSLSTIDGKIIKLSELKGKTVFINFFTLSCPACMKELPKIEAEIWPRYKDNENIVILIIGRGESIAALNAFREKKQFTFPMACDPDRKVYALFADKYVPRNIVIDKEGVLVLTETGYTEEKSKDLFQKIENLLENEQR